MKIPLLFMIMSMATCSATGSEPMPNNQSIKPITIYPKSDNWSPEQAKGFRAIYELKCKAGENAYCFDLARMLMEGIGGEKDQKRAASLIKSACKNGYQLACK